MPYFVDFLQGHEASIRQFSGRSLRLGRGTNADLRLDDPSVALEHAVIEQDDDGGGGWTVHDRGSVTGTFVNDERVASARLGDGDRIDVGAFRLRIEILSAEDPLFLHVARLDESGGEPASTLTLNTLSAPSADLLAMVDATRRLGAVGGEEDSFMTMAAATLRLSEEPKPPTPSATAPTSSAPPPTSSAAPAVEARATSPARDLRRVDFVRAYRLDRGLLTKTALTTVAALATAGGLLALFESGRRDVFSPGALTTPHRTATNDACAACHSGWRPVASASCQSSKCHDAVGDHQTTQLRQPSCLECHLEHRGLDALRLLADGGCVGCHGELRTTQGESSFASQITGFGPGVHPGFTPRTDPGALDFHHAWHLTKVLREGRPALDCESCHKKDDEGEIEPLSFEEVCQECHNLTFDLRFGVRQAPHATMAEVVTYLAGFYLQSPEVLGRLRIEERGRLRGRNLSQEQQLAVVAEWNAGALLRNKCSKCHKVAGDPRRPPADVEVLPARLAVRWLEHAEFRHGPHLELDMKCDDCHESARSSNEAYDVLLPDIEVCRECHRPALAGESPKTAVLGRTDCVGCHTYHPEPGEASREDFAVRVADD